MHNNQNNNISRYSFSATQFVLLDIKVTQIEHCFNSL